MYFYIPLHNRTKGAGSRCTQNSNSEHIYSTIFFKFNRCAFTFLTDLHVHLYQIHIHERYFRHFLYGDTTVQRFVQVNSLPLCVLIQAESTAHKHIVDRQHCDCVCSYSAELWTKKRCMFQVQRFYITHNITCCLENDHAMPIH